MMIKKFKDFVNQGSIQESDENKETEKEQAEPTADSTKDSNESVAKMLEKVYEKAVYEAKAWESDTHDAHTIESYMAENAALVAQLMTTKLKEMNEEWTVEMYEAACEKLKESYSKKVDEMKDMEKATTSEEK